MTGSSPRPEPPPVTLKTLVLVSCWGGGSTAVAYALAHGSLPLFVLWIVVIGFLARLVARVVVRRHERQPPRGR